MSDDILRAKREKIRALRERGINPYPYRFERTHTLTGLQDDFDALESSGRTVRVAGRVMLHRPTGKITFFHVEDMGARMQFSARADEVDPETYRLVKSLDAGDFVGAEGVLWRTRKGERTLGVRKLELLCKPVRPLPEKYHGLKDKELRYRQRDLDWIMDASVRRTFARRARAIASIRHFMDERGFLEVDVPYIQMAYGGAEARPFTTHIHAIDTQAYLSISPELFLKRYVVGGFDAVYCIARNFRNEGIDATHNPEFTSLEAYQAYADYNDLMTLVEDLFEHVFRDVLGTTEINYQGRRIEMAKPWPRRPVYDLLREESGIDAKALAREELVAEIRRRAEDDAELNAIDVSASRPTGYIVLDLLDHYCEAKLVQPTFVIDYPRDTSPLCKVHREDATLIERFEPFIAGLEMGNAYSELNDPVEQRRLMEEQAANLRAGQQEAMPMDEGFARAIEYGMPPTGGLGIGIDRLVMLLTDAHSIRDVIAFPMMKPGGRRSGQAMSEETDEAAPEGGKAPATDGAPPDAVVWDEPDSAGLDAGAVQALFDEHISERSLRAHCIASGAALRALARHFGRNEDTWHAAGLLHDLDFEVEQAPDKHGLKTRAWLLAAGMDAPLVESMIAHNEGLGIPRHTAFEHLLAAAETLTGLVRAVALIYPDKKIAGVKPKSVTKRLKDKRFAAKVNRDVIRECERAGLTVQQLVEITLDAMQCVADEIGL